MQEKDALRRKLKAEKITGRIWKQTPDAPFFNKMDFDVLLSFIPLEGEVDVTPLINRALEHSLCVAVPTTDYLHFACLEKGWEKSKIQLSNGTRSYDGKLLDIRTLEDKKTVILVPALACTESGLRLGRGGGFYDRILSVLCEFPSVKSICMVPKERIFEALPVEEHDMRVSQVIGF